MWPLLLGHGLALGLTEPPSRVLALDLEGAGRQRWRSDPLPWPEDASMPINAASAVHAGWLDDRILLCWQLRSLYRGGAAPDPASTRPGSSVGSCLLAPDTGALESAPAPAVGLPPTPGQVPSDDPTVLAQAHLDGVAYRLQRGPPQGDKVQTALVAHHLARGLDMWSTAFEDARPDGPSTRPRALRP